MTRTYALLKLLELGPLDRKQIREITGWSEDKLKYVIAGAADKGDVRNVEGIWYRRYPDRTLQTATL